MTVQDGPGRVPNRTLQRVDRTSVLAEVSHAPDRLNFSLRVVELSLQGWLPDSEGVRAPRDALDNNPSRESNPPRLHYTGEEAS